LNMTPIFHSILHEKASKNICRVRRHQPSPKKSEHLIATHKR
jgi:hypothetical protein